MSGYTEAFWVPHCDDVSCSLGAFEYTCPACQKGGRDFDVWWDFENLLMGSLPSREFRCDHCRAELVVTYDREEYETQVRRKDI